MSDEDLFLGTYIYFVKTDEYFSSSNDVQGYMLLLKYPTQEETLANENLYFEEDGSGMWSDTFCGWIYPYNNYELDRCNLLGATWKGELLNF